MIRIVAKFSQLARKIPLIDLQSYLTQKKSTDDDCRIVMKAFHHYGCIIVKDPRINHERNDQFLDLFQKYFSKRQKQLDRGQRQDIYEELAYQVGLTPPYVHILEDQSENMKKNSGKNSSLTPLPNQPLSRMRFFWNAGKVTDDIPQNKTPIDFPEMKKVLDDWGSSTLNTIHTISQMLAIGLDLPKETFTEKLSGGATKLSPLANDLRRTKLGEPFVGFHYDFTFITAHGKSRFPGLYVWLADGEKLKVSIPEGHLLLQAGSQLEMMTGGYILNGYHQAINTEQVQKLAKQAMEKGRQPWRITSTVFSHLRSDVVLEPIGKYATKEAMQKYRPIKQGDYMKRLIELRQKKKGKG